MAQRAQPILLTSRKRSVIALRGVMTLAIAAVSLQELTRNGPALAVLALYAITNVVLFFERPQAFIQRAPAMLLFAFDLAAVTLLMLLSGETQTQFYLCFFLIILMAALTHSARSAVIIAALSAGAYALMAEVRGAEGLFDLAFTTRAALFFVTALFAGYLAEETDGERRRSTLLAETVKVQAQAHRQSEERFRRLAENIREVFWVTSARGGRVLYVSPGYAAVWGRSCQSLYDAPDSWREAVHPEDRARVLDAARAADGGIDLEYRILRPDGTVRWIRDRRFPMADARGEVDRLAGLAEDVTEVRRLSREREALQELSRALNGPLDPAEAGRLVAATCRALLDPDAFLLCRRGPLDPELEAVYVEDARGGGGTRAGARPAPPSGPGPREPIHVEDPSTPGIAPFLPDRGAEPPPVSGMIAPIVWESRELGFLSCWSDRPRRYAAEDLRFLGSLATLCAGVLARLHAEEQLRTREDQLRHAQKMEAVGRLAGGVAHDFNNLLTAITGYGELLARQIPPDDPSALYVGEIEAAASRATSLTSQLLAFSRRQVLQPAVLDLNEVLRGMTSLLQRLITENIELVTRLAPDLGHVRADKGGLEQIVMNLAVNARDAMPRGGTLVLSTANEDGAVLLEVADTGAGMSAETRAHLFEPYFTTKQEGKGTGLGLATVHGIVTQSDGTIEVDSEPGRGCRIRIRLPRLDLPVDRPPGRAAPSDRYRGSETILMVEDSDIVRRLAREVLVGQGYAVLEARNGAEASRFLESSGRAVDLLLTDVVMPEMNGPELVARVRPGRPDMKIIFMSGYPEEAVSNAGVLRTQAAFLPKPFTPVALMQKIREALDAPAA